MSEDERTEVGTIESRGRADGLIELGESESLSSARGSRRSSIIGMREAIRRRARGGGSVPPYGRGGGTG
ncbi:MAG: hypothetical protein FJ104_14570 [Deltaproteobacteria bacterium]|nr:hypothetical protein [Deltaproteobacteria bacterium]